MKEKINNSLTTLPSIRRLLPKNCKFIEEDFLAYGDPTNVPTHNLNASLNKFLKKGPINSSTIVASKRGSIFQSPALRNYKRISKNHYHNSVFTYHYDILDIKENKYWMNQ